MGNVLTFATSQSLDKTLLEEIKSSKFYFIRIHVGTFDRYN